MADAPPLTRDPIAEALEARKAGRLDEARKRLLALLPFAKDDEARAVLHRLLGDIDREAKRPQAAMLHLRRARALAPDDRTTRLLLATWLGEDGQLAEAASLLSQALDTDPDNLEACNNLGNLFLGMGRPDDAVRCYRMVLTKRPDLAAAHYNLASALLASGDLKHGFAEYEWRWKLPSFGSIRRHAGKPRWNGESFAGKTLLVWPEQGLGDLIQFVRLLPLVRARGGRVVFECPQPLARLFATARGIDALVPFGAPPPAFDLQIPLLSLPMVLGLTLDELPAETPYLTPPPDPSAQARADKRLRIGLAWGGNPNSQNDRLRSVSLDRFGDLLARDDMVFVSLQKGPAAEQLERLGFDAFMENRAPALMDFADTARAIQNLDLVLSVDNAVAHVAGALGVPCWILLSRLADWRWLLKRGDTPWYPNTRLFRQDRLGDWTAPLAKITSELDSLAKASQKK